MNTNKKSEEIGAFDTVADSYSRDLGKAMDATWLKSKNSDFDTLVHEYKRVESEFISRASSDECQMLETRQRVAEALFKEAVQRQQPFETCRTLWNDLLRLGFVDIEQRCFMSWYLAECCRQNRRPEIGLRVIDPLMEELSRLLAEPGIVKHAENFHENQVNVLQKLQGELRSLSDSTSI